tara:strand:+ start:24 stop:662 length:639 start_codon:yes stop_codon:yes gene_type:complete
MSLKGITGKHTAVIYSLFPTPIYSNQLNRNFTQSELSLVEEFKKKCVSNPGNITSRDNYILNHKNFKKLKLNIEYFLQDYFDKIVCPSRDVKFYITQSWLNYTKANEFHHEHEHANSYLSGVLYFNADDKFDKISFLKKVYNQITVETKNFNIYNSDAWWISIKTGQILIFPSRTTHLVKRKKEDNTRISLAFNTFLKGDLGTIRSLTELKL